MKKYLAELIGTFGLALAVAFAVSAGGGIPVPIIAALTLALFVYSIGTVSGCHINPAVTLGQVSLGKITSREALKYIAAQFIGAVLALVVAKLFHMVGPVVAAAPTVWSTRVFFAELIGAFFFNFGIASVVYGKTPSQMSGAVIGGSLLLGVVVAAAGGSLGILNPAVALTLGSLTLSYAIGPVVGAVAGVLLYKYLVGNSEK